MRSLLLIVWLLFPALAQAVTVPSEFVAPQFVRADEGTDEALPNAVLTSLAQDRDGLVWVGTARGVVRFDGHRFRSYGNRWSSAGSETSLFVRSLLVARDGTLWVGSDFAGLARYNPLLDRLDPVPLPVSGAEGLTVNALVEDDQGRLWIGTDGHGVLLRERDGQVRQLRVGDGKGLPDDQIRQLLIDREGVLWIATWSGLTRLSVKQPDSALTTINLASTKTNISGLFEASDGWLWVGSGEGGLWRLAPGTRQPEVVSDSTRTGAVYVFLQPDADSVWVGRTDGIDIRNRTDGRLLQHLRHRADDPRSLAGNEVRTMMQGRGGLIWVGGYGGGLQRFNPHNVAFRTLDRVAFADAGPGFDDPNVRSMTVLEDGQVLLGTENHGILALDAQLHPREILADAHGKPLLLGVRITALTQAHDGTLWIGSDAGLFRRVRKDLEQVPYPSQHGIVRKLAAQPNGAIWIATEDGLLRRDPDGTIEPMRDTEGTTLRRSVNALGWDSAGRLWIGGELGIGVIDTSGKPVVRRIETHHPARGSNTDVIGLLVDAQDRIWFDTPSGLYRLDAEHDGQRNVEAISASHGEAGRPFGANLLMDAQGRVWSQDRVFDPAASRILTLGHADGADLGSPWFRSYGQLPDGRLLFGGTLGLLVIDPARYQPQAYHAPLVITALRVDGTPIAPASAANGLTLTPTQRRVDIEFAALDYSAPDLLQYRYRLAGTDTPWTTTDSTNRVATFVNLPPGHHQFELKGRDRLGNEGDATLRLDIEVIPAWWQRRWVQLLGVLLGLLCLHALMQSRTRWLRARQHELERRVASRTQQLQELTAALREKSKALEEASLTDPLTGLRNRRHFSQFIDHAVATIGQQTAPMAGVTAPQAGHGLAFFLFDVDHFKQVNDQFGHAAGDAVLQQVAARLRERFPSDAELVRWGGEEFLVVACGMDAERATALAAQVLVHLNEHSYLLPDQRALQRPCSLGLALYPMQAAYPHQLSWQQVLELADSALYVAKRAGRKAWVGFSGGTAGPLAPDAVSQLAEEIVAGHVRVHGSVDDAQVLQRLRESTS